MSTCQRCDGLDREGQPIDAQIAGRVSSDEIDYLVCESCLAHAERLTALLPKSAEGKLRVERFNA